MHSSTTALSAKIQLSNLLREALSEFGDFSLDILVEKPTSQQHGDYYSNCALSLFGKLRTLNTKLAWNSPLELAEYLVEKMLKAQPALLDTCVAVQPGFINFSLSKEYLVSNLGFLSKIGTFPESTLRNGQNIVVEFTDPNPFKEFHIGHLYSNTIGESLARLIEASGATVHRADYFGDVGMHVAKSIWGMQQKMVNDSVTLADMGTWPLVKRIEFLGQAYAQGAAAYTEDKQVEAEIKQLNFLVYLAAQERLIEEENWQPVLDYNQFIQAESKMRYSEIKELYLTGRSWSLQYFDSIYARLGMKFDGYYPESKAGELGAQLVRDQLEKGVFKHSQNAVIFEGSAHGLHDRVFLNSMGLPTYEAKELALPKLKQQDFKYDHSVIITGNEINEYFKVLLKALSLIEPTIAAQTTHIGHGMVRLPEGKMSSRTGNIIAGTWLLDQAVTEVIRVASWPAEELAQKQETAELVGQAAIKYAFLKQSIGDDIAFSFSESLDFQGNSGPYLLYSYVRAHNVFKQAGDVLQVSIDELKDILSNKKVEYTYKYTDLEIDILRHLEKYKDTVEIASADLTPHILCSYVYDLAQLFNRWYAKQRIVVAEDNSATLTLESYARLALTDVVAKVLQRSLFLLGIRTVKTM